jgi:TP901 family phage tail tape measure protein
VSVVANVAINLDATGVSSQLKAIHAASLNAANGITQFADRVKAAKAATEAAQGGFAKASTVQGVFTAKVKNTEQAITAQIAALKQVQSTVQFGGALYQKAGAQIQQYQAVLNSVNTPAEKTVGLFGRLKQAAGSLVGQLAITASAAGLVRTAFAILQEQSKAEGGLRTLGVDANAASAAFMKLSIELRGQASAVELTAAAYNVASAGFTKVADQTVILSAATKGAVGGFSDINTVADATTSILNAYGKSANDAGIIVDQLIQTQNDGKTTVAQYADAIGRVIPTAAAAGVSIEEINAAVAALTVKGTISSESVSGLKAAIAAIIGPTAEAQAKARELGIEFNAEALASKGLTGVLNDVAKATNSNTGEMNQFFGSAEALNAVLSLTAGSGQKFAQYLENQKNATGAADKAFQDMSNTLGGALKEVDTAFKNLVVAFAPITPAIIAPFKVLAGAVNLVTENIKALAVAAVFIGTFAAVLNASAIATKAWAIATGLLAAAKKAAGIAAAFLQGVMNPASLATTALALGAATAAAVTLGNAMGESGLKAEEAKLKQVGVAGATDEVKNKTAELTGETNKQAAALDQIPPKQQAQATAAQKALVSLQGQTAAINAQIASLERGASIASARYGAEKAINDLQGQQLERAYGLQTTAQGRLNIAVQIFNNAVKSAKIEHSQALENIALEQRKIELQVQLAQLKSKEIEAEGQLQILKSKDAAEAAEKQRQLDTALAAQNEVVTATQAQSASQQEIAKYQEQTAGAQLESKILAAQTALEAKLTSDNIGLSQSNAVKLSSELSRGVSSTNSLATGTGQVATNAQRSSSMFIQVANSANQAAAAINNAANQQARLNTLRSQSGGGGGGGGSKPPVKKAADGAYWPGGFKAFADGGVVNKPTMGLVGEGGESEYIIPASKMKEAMKRYAEGKRGNSVIPSTVSPQVNVTTGPVMSMNGQNYVNQRDLVSGLMSASRSTAESVIDMLRSDMSVRREIGLS